MTTETYRGMPPHVDVETSIEAAESVQETSARDRTRVLEYLRMRSELGGTDEEIALVLRMPQNTARPRRRELVLMGLVVASEERRLTSTKRRAIVWKAANGVLPMQLPVERRHEANVVQREGLKMLIALGERELLKPLCKGARCLDEAIRWLRGHTS